MTWEIWAVIIGSVASSLATIVAVILKHKLGNGNKDCPIKEESSHNENVYSALHGILEQMGGDRAYVLEFHNGGHYLSGRGQQKFSCSHEVVEEGISSECQASQDYRTSNYHGYISELINEGSFAYSDVPIMPHQGFRALLEEKGVRSIFNVPIKTINGNIIGILGVDYVKSAVSSNIIGFKATDEKGSLFGDKELSFMEEQSLQIAGYLL